MTILCDTQATTLLREFTTHLKGKGRFKTFRLEAVRASFSRAWQERDYLAIIQVAEHLRGRPTVDNVRRQRPPTRRRHAEAGETFVTSAVYTFNCDSR